MERHVQRLPNGEVRVYEPDGEGVWRLVGRTTGSGSVYAGPAIGEPMETVEARFPKTRRELPKADA